MGMIKLTSKGSWSVHCPSDPRWNAHGTSESVGGFVMPAEVKLHIAKMEAQLGISVPPDCEFSYMKD